MKILVNKFLNLYFKIYHLEILNKKYQTHNIYSLTRCFVPCPEMRQ